MATRAISWLQILQQDPTLLDIISFYDMVLFVDLACHLRERIRWNQSDDVTGPPINLPISVHNFLRDALKAEDHLVRSFMVISEATCLGRHIWLQQSLSL